MLALLKRASLLLKIWNVNMRSYKAIVFDLGNTLLPFDYNKMIINLNAIEAGLGEKLYKAYWDNYDVHRKFERGEISEEEFLEFIKKLVDGKIDKEAFCKYYSEIFEEDVKTTSLLPLLKKNYKLYLLSNTNPIHRRYGYSRFEFLNYFDELFFSDKIKLLKPEPQIYDFVQKAINCLPENILFIDDVEPYVSAAIDAGWDGIVFKGYENLIKEFDKRNIKYY